VEAAKGGHRPKVGRRATVVAGLLTERCGWFINSLAAVNCGAARVSIADQPSVGARLLAKLQEFHRVHKTPIDQSIRDLNEAFAWLPQSAYAAEAKPLKELACKKRRGVQRIGDLMVPLLLRLGVSIEEDVESKTSEARSSD